MAMRSGTRVGTPVIPGQRPGVKPGTKFERNGDTFRRPATVLGDWSIHPGRRCTQVDPELFFPPGGNTRSETLAKALCGRCPVRTECLAYALDAEPAVVGIWGATNETERRRMRRDRSS